MTVHEIVQLFCELVIIVSPMVMITVCLSLVIITGFMVTHSVASEVFLGVVPDDSDDKNDDSGQIPSWHEDNLKSN